MKKSILLIIYILTFHLLFSQGSTTYILKDGREITPSEAGVAKPKKGVYVFLLDGESINSQDMAYVIKKDETLKVGPIDKNNKLLLYKKTSDGPRIDFYTKQVRTVDTYPHKGYKKRKVEFFEKDQDILKKINYRNVKEAVSDNPLSLEVLKKADNLRFITGLAIGASFIVPLVAFLSSSEASLSSSEESNPTNLVLAGPLIWAVPLSLKDIKQKHYLEALRVYNELAPIPNPITK